MKRTSLLLRLLLAVALSTGAAAAAHAQQSIVEPVYRDYAPPPPTVGEMALAADAVVIAKFTGQRRTIVENPQRALASFSTNYAFQIVDVIKFDFLLGNVGEQFEINLAGGVRTVGNQRIERVLPDTNALRANATYVVFLKRNTVRDELYPAWQQSSLFEVTATGIQAIDRTKPGHNGKAIAAFLDEVRRGRP